MASLKNTIINDTGFLQVASGNTAARTRTSTGVIRYNLETKKLEGANSSNVWIDFT